MRRQDCRHSELYQDSTALKSLRLVLRPSSMAVDLTDAVEKVRDIIGLYLAPQTGRCGTHPPRLCPCRGQTGQY